MTFETITEYIADDGQRFRSSNACERHERELAELAPIVARIPESKLESNQYVQHDPEVLRRIKRDLWKLVLRDYGDTYPKWKQINPDDVHPLSFVGRVLSDAGISPLETAWSKLARFDFVSGREYQQPYFVSHMDKAPEEVRIADRLDQSTCRYANEP